jgi:hypothetical protein
MFKANHPDFLELNFLPVALFISKTNDYGIYITYRS